MIAPRMALDQSRKMDLALAFKTELVLSEVTHRVCLSVVIRLL